MNRRLPRRRFIKAVGLGSIGAAVSSRFGWLPSARAAEPPEETALRDGILILGEEEPIPSWVRPMERSPILHGRPRQTFHETMTASELAERVDFPVYALSEPPPGYRFYNAVLLHHISGFVHVASVNYALVNPRTERPASMVSLVANPPGAYPEPFPMRTVTLQNGARAVPRPAPGLPGPAHAMFGDRDSFVAWVEKRVLYSLQITAYDDLPEAINPAEWERLVPLLQQAGEGTSA